MYTRDHIVRGNRESKIPGINAVIEEMDDRLFTGESKGLAYALELSDGEGDAMVSVDFDDLLEGGMKAEYIGVSWGRIEFLFIWKKGMKLCTK